MNEIIQALKSFDRKRAWNTYEREMSQEELIRTIHNLLVATMGELGEFANEVKKCHRDNTWNDAALKEELTDTFIYLLKLSFTLNMDLKESFFAKLAKNEERFKHFTSDEKV